MGCVGGYAQESPHAFRIPVRHADPWMIKAMMEGRPIAAPELSASIGIGGMVGQMISAVGSLIQNGVLIVNPTDNSLWWLPKPKGTV